MKSTLIVYGLVLAGFAIAVPANLGPAFPAGVFTLHNGAVAPFPIEVCDLRDLGLE